MEELLTSLSVLAPILIAPVVAFVVQSAKRAGADPLLALGTFSVVAAIAYSAAKELIPEEYWEWMVMFAFSVAGIANMLYSVFKRYFPEIRSK